MPGKAPVITCENLHELSDGSVGVAVNRALESLVADLHDRPGLAKPRALTLKLTLKPLSNDGQFLDNVHISFEINETVPKKSTMFIVPPVGQKGLGMPAEKGDAPGQKRIFVHDDQDTEAVG